MITFGASIRKASAITDDAITTSSVGIPVKLHLAQEFNGLAKTLVFSAGTAKADIVLVGDATDAICPVDVLGVAGAVLKMGIYAADGNGTIVIPTVWATVGQVVLGATPSGVDPSDPVPNWVAQVQEIASEASEDAADALTIAQGVKAQADAGDFNGRDGTDGTDGVSPTVSVSDITGGHRVVITDLNGSHTFDVINGVDGTDGTDGTDGYSPTVSITDITGGHRVTITDVNGSHSFDVMDGTGGGGGAVDSVNGQTGTVVLDAADVGALPDSTTIPSAATSAPADLGTKAVGTSTKYAREDHVHEKPSYSKSDVGLGNVDNVQQYSANNPPPYPVSSVNGQTGAVTLSIPSSASDVGAVASNQGSGNAGKFMVVGSDGIVAPVTMAAWSGGSY